MSTLVDIPDVEMVWRGKHAEALVDSTRELNVEGAIRAGKTTVCLWRELNAALAHPGIHALFARWTDIGVYGLVMPLWRHICEQAGVRLKWYPDEEYDLLPNGSRVYVRGLKSQDQTLRYSKLRGLTLARVYVDQAEELPRDIYLELAGRLSQPGFPHQITISPQSVEEGHWIAKEFPVDNHFAPHRLVIQLSIHDNAHNLAPEVVPALMRLYPPEHPKHRTMILGQRGMNVIGEPVYGGTFVRSLHEQQAVFDPALALDEGIDFGKHHPCVVWRQTSALGQVRYLGGLLGQDLYLEDFLLLVVQYRNRWFPQPAMVRMCCDPSGDADTSHGTKGGADIIKDLIGQRPQCVAGSNSPSVRTVVIERIAGHMRHRTAGKAEAFVVAKDERWLRLSATNTVIDHFLADGFEAGYVWGEHMVSDGRKQYRVPKKDGWYEHGQNCAEYLEVNFGAVPWKPKVKPETRRRGLAEAGGTWAG